jgi:sugar O-acyltransferase (sialic acid O-acetyltransferase NeuD family)
MKKVVIFGNTRWAELVHFYLTHDSPFEVAGFTVDPQYIYDSTFVGLPVVPFDSVEAAFPPTEYSMLIAVSYQQMNTLRKEKYYQARTKGYEMITYISSKTTTWPDLNIGDNCLVVENTSLNPFVKIGNNVTIGANVLIGHHAVINDHCFISPGAVILGSVEVETSCVIGAGSTIREKVKIASKCMVGAGVTITADTKEGSVYIGRTPQLLSMSSERLVKWLMWSEKSKNH